MLLVPQTQIRSGRRFSLVANRPGLDTERADITTNGDDIRLRIVRRVPNPKIMFVGYIRGRSLRLLYRLLIATVPHRPWVGCGTAVCCDLFATFARRRPRSLPENGEE